MENIGRILKQRREELGLSIDDVSDRTRLTIKHIKAIEEGEISYFRDDLSYLRFFLRSYCEVLGIDFEDIKGDLSDSIDDYTASFTVNTMKKHQAIEKNVQKNAANLKKSSTQKKIKKPRKTRRRLDMSLVSFIIIVFIIVLSLIAAFIIFIKNSNDSPKEDPKPEVTQNEPLEPQKPKEETKEPEIEEQPFAVTKISDTEFTLDHVKDGSDIDIEVYFGSYSHFRALVNDAELSDPAAKVYNYKETIHVKQQASQNMKITLAFGFMQNNTIKINGIDVEIADTLNKGQSVTLNFTVKGE